MSVSIVVFVPTLNTLAFSPFQVKCRAILCEYNDFPRHGGPQTHTTSGAFNAHGVLLVLLMLLVIAAMPLLSKKKKYEN